MTDKVRLKNPDQNALIKHAKLRPQFTSGLKIIAARNHYHGENWPFLKGMTFVLGPLATTCGLWLKRFMMHFVVLNVSFKISHGSFMSDKIWWS